jgi:hypothetical protein
MSIPFHMRYSVQSMEPTPHFRLKMPSRNIAISRGDPINQIRGLSAASSKNKGYRETRYPLQAIIQYPR